MNECFFSVRPFGLGMRASGTRLEHIASRVMPNSSKRAHSQDEVPIASNATWLDPARISKIPGLLASLVL